MPYRQLPFGASQAFVNFPGVEGQLQASWVRIADVFRGNPYQPASDVQGVAATVEHPGEPIECCVRIGSANRLVQSGNLVVKILPLLIETPTTT